MASSKMLLAFVGLCVLSLSMAPEAEGKHHQKKHVLASIIREIVGIVVQTVLSPEQVGDIYQRFPQEELEKLIKQLKTGVLSGAIAKAGTDELTQTVGGFSNEVRQEIFEDAAAGVKDLSPEDLLKTVQNLSPEKLAVFALNDPANILGDVIQALPSADLGESIIANLEDFLEVLKPTDIKVFVRAIVKYFTGDLLG